MSKLCRACQIVVLLSLCAMSSVSIAAGDPVRRLAFIIGSNNGGTGRVQLRYANKDAEAFSVVLKELGGVAADDVILVENATRPSVAKGLESLQRLLNRSAAHHERMEIIFYYSGHSNENGLLLGGDLYTYKDFKALVSSLPVDVRVMVIDSCESGHLTLAKGGQRRPAFLLDASSKTQGQAIITSSSSDEAAQESANVSGSIFTHYFLSGLRGAADVNGDGKVTLNEAYHYAYAETLARTEATRSGPQHPSYDFQLAGTGDLVLTDLRESNATLSLPPAARGRYFIRNDAGELVAEVNKPAGRKMELGLEPGQYHVIREIGKERSEATFTLAASGKVDGGELPYKHLEGEANTTRGDAEYKPTPTNLGVLPPAPTEWSTATNDELHYFSLDLLGGHSGKVQGATVATLAHVVDEGGVDGAMLALGVNYNRGHLTGGEMSYLGNYTGGDVLGFQASFVGDYAASNVTGFQAAAGGNYAAGTVKGFQAAYIGNYAGGEARGIQAAAVANVSNGMMRGTQFAAGVNVALTGVEGLQLAALNYASNVTGAQVGYVNVTTQDIDGAQVGLVNYAKSVDGLQFGLVNYADTIDGVPIGLVSYVRNGRKDIDVWVDEVGFFHVTYKMGVDHFYTLYDVAARGVTKGTKEVAGIGFGALYGQGSWYLSVEGMTDSDADTSGHAEKGANGKELDRFIMARGQGSVGYRLSKRLSVYGGPSFSHCNRGRDDFAHAVNAQQWAKETSVNSTSWGGAQLGTKVEL